MKVYPMKRAKRFGKKGKLSPCKMVQCLILKRVANVSYELYLPLSLGSIHQNIAVLMLKKCMGNAFLVVPIERADFSNSLSYEKVPIEILDRQFHFLSTKDAASVKVLWRNHKVEETTLEAKD